MTSADLDQVLESLRQCQLELAQVRSSQEPLQEELAEVRARLESVLSRFETLSREVNDHLSTLADAPPSHILRQRVSRWKAGRRAERQQAKQLRESPLFNGPWYLRRYPRVLRTGLPPAVHYLRHGAADGLDPSPRFTTSSYLSAHPEVAASGENPLIHHLRSSSGRGPVGGR